MTESGATVHERDPARHLRALRESKGLSRKQVARSSGLSQRKLSAFEHGRASMSESDLLALGAALDVEPSALVPAGYRLALVQGTSGSVPQASDADAALDTLLREYLSMVVELRGSADGLESSLRHEDLKELSRALGGTPEAVEAKVMQLLATGPHEASHITRTIMPSIDGWSTS